MPNPAASEAVGLVTVSPSHVGLALPRGLGGRATITRAHPPWDSRTGFNSALTSVTHVSTAGHAGGVVPAVSSPVASAQFLSIVNTVIALAGAVLST